MSGRAETGTTILSDSNVREMYLARAEPGLVVINTANETIDRVLDGPRDPTGIAEDGSFLYVTSGQDNSLTVYSKATWTTTDVIKIEGKAPGGVWLDSSRNQLDVLAVGSHEVEAYTSGANPTWRASYPLPPGATLRAAAATLDTARHVLYVAEAATVFQVDLATGQVRPLAGLPIGGATVTGLAYDPRTSDLWASTSGNQVIVLDIPSARVIKTLPSPPSDQIAFDPVLRFMYVLGKSGFWAYDTNLTVPWSRVDLADPDGLIGAVDPKSHYLYVYAGGTNMVTVFNWPGGASASGLPSLTGGSSAAPPDAASGSTSASPGDASGGTAADSTTSSGTSAGGAAATSSTASTASGGATGPSVSTLSTPTSGGSEGSSPSLAGPTSGSSSSSGTASGGVIFTPIPIPTPIPFSVPTPASASVSGSSGQSGIGSSLGPSAPRGSGAGTVPTLGTPLPSGFAPPTPS
jgi:hypothetical protein